MILIVVLITVPQAHELQDLTKKRRAALRRGFDAVEDDPYDVAPERWELVHPCVRDRRPPPGAPAPGAA